MLALELWRAGQCNRCGGDLAETTDPKHSIDNPYGTHIYRRAELKRCHRCTALMESERLHAEVPKGAAPVQHAHAVMHYVELVPRGSAPVGVTPGKRVPRTAKAARQPKGR